jgi:hypothetical protein
LSVPASSVCSLICSTGSSCSMLIAIAPISRAFDNGSGMRSTRKTRDAPRINAE